MAPKDNNHGIHFEQPQQPMIAENNNNNRQEEEQDQLIETDGGDDKDWKRNIFKKLQQWWKEERTSSTATWTAAVVILAAAVTAYSKRQARQRMTHPTTSLGYMPGLMTSARTPSSRRLLSSPWSLLVVPVWKALFPSPQDIVESSLSLLQMAARRGLVKRVLVGSSEILYQRHNDTGDTWRRSRLPSNSPGLQAELLDLLTNHGCQDITALPESLLSRLTGPFLAALPFVYLVLVYKIFKNIQNGGNDITVLTNTPDSHMEKIKFSDVAGLEPIMPEIQEIVYFLKNPQQYRALGAQPPKGILLQGPPGAGKTLLAKAVAGEANAAFCACSGSDFCEMYVGRGAARVRTLFQKAKRLALQRHGQSWWSHYLRIPSSSSSSSRSPSHLAPPPTAIIFIDEFDALAKTRAYGGLHGNDEREATLNQLLTEMDGFESASTNSSSSRNHPVTIILIAATNRPDVLDPAILRRFDRQIHVPYPNAQGRRDIFHVHAKSTNFPMDQIDWDYLASDEWTANFSGSDLKNVVNDAALLAVRDRSTQVHQTHLLQAIERVRAMKTTANLSSRGVAKQLFFHLPK